MTALLNIEALPGVLENRGKRSFISGEKGNKGHFEGNRGTETIMESREHKKTKNLRILLRRGISLNVICEKVKFLDCDFCHKKHTNI